MELLQEYLNFLTLKNRYWGRSNSFREEIELKEKTEKRIDEIEKLGRKKEIKLEKIFIIDDEAIDLLIELNIDKRDIQEQLIFIDIKLEKLKISEKTIKAIRSQIIGH